MLQPINDNRDIIDKNGESKEREQSFYIEVTTPRENNEKFTHPKGWCTHKYTVIIHVKVNTWFPIDRNKLRELKCILQIIWKYK